MKTKHLFLLLAFVITPLFVNAQICTPEEEEVWEWVQKSWEVFASGDIDGYLDMIDENYAGWAPDIPYVIPKETIYKNMKSAEELKNLETKYRVIPEKIIVKGNSAAVFYYYTMKSTWGEGEDKGKWERKGRFSDFLIKENGKWKYLAGMGVDEKD